MLGIFGLLRVLIMAFLQGLGFFLEGLFQGVYAVSVGQ